MKSHMCLPSVPCCWPLSALSPGPSARPRNRTWIASCAPFCARRDSPAKSGTLWKRVWGVKWIQISRDLGKLLFFDTVTGLHNDNTCAGCHSPTNGFGDTQSIAIGIDNNGVAGKDRTGPRNQRRTPMVINAAFFPNLMWNSRFASPSGVSFDILGIRFPCTRRTHAFLSSLLY